jgi:DNA-binding NtrC family response regulator
MTTKVLVVGADPALAELLEEWLTLESCHAVAERPDVVLVDVPFPRELAVQRLQHIGDEHPGTPVLPMPKPLTRDAFVAVLRRAKDAIQ